MKKQIQKLSLNKITVSDFQNGDNVKGGITPTLFIASLVSAALSWLKCGGEGF